MQNLLPGKFGQAASSASDSMKQQHDPNSGAAGFLTVALEAPFCCAFVDFIERIAQFSESRAYWQKAALYCIMGAIPCLICFELGTVLGTAMIIAAGFAYGFMALGKKADRDTMMGNIGGGGQDPAWSPQVNQPFPQPAGFNQP
uniref:Calcium channel flower n=1 Tax=Meloidogyne javanica TaxID=6303 RepID=A0A915LPQ2_MELJA